MPEKLTEAQRLEREKPLELQMCTCGHGRDQHYEDAKCGSWKCVCPSFKSVVDQRVEQYGE